MKVYVRGRSWWGYVGGKRRSLGLDSARPEAEAVAVAWQMNEGDVQVQAQVQAVRPLYVVPDEVPESDVQEIEESVHETKTCTHTVQMSTDELIRLVVRVVLDTVHEYEFERTMLNVQTVPGKPVDWAAWIEARLPQWRGKK